MEVSLVKNIIQDRAVTILDFSQHDYCGQNNSWYWYIAICRYL